MNRLSSREGKTWPSYVFGGRMRTSTLVLIIAFLGVGWLYETYEPGASAPQQIPASEVVPPGFIPDPNYTWAPRTDVQRQSPTTTSTTPTTTSTTPTTPTTPTSATDTSAAPTPAEPPPSSSPMPSPPSPSAAPPPPAPEPTAPAASERPAAQSPTSAVPPGGAAPTSEPSTR